MSKTCESILTNAFTCAGEIKSFDDLKIFLSTALQWDFHTFCKNRSQSGGGGGFKVFNEFGITDKSMEHTFDDFKDEYNSDLNKLFKSDGFISYVELATNKSVADAWKRCITGGGRRTVAYYVGDPLSSFTAMFTYLSDDAANDPTLTIYSSSFPDCVPEPTSPADPPSPTDPIDANTLKPGGTKKFALRRSRASRESTAEIKFTDGSDVNVVLPAMDIDRRLAEIDDRIEKLEDLMARLGQGQRAFWAAWPT